jgi:hypothetical protein
VAPWGQPDLDFLAGQGQENIDEFKAATDGIEALTVWMNKNAPEFAAVTGPSLIECFGGLLSEPDKVIMTPAFAEEDAAIIRRALLIRSIYIHIYMYMYILMNFCFIYIYLFLFV